MACLIHLSSISSVQLIWPSGVLTMNALLTRMCCHFDDNLLIFWMLTTCVADPQIDCYCMNSGTCRVDKITTSSLCACPIGYSGPYCERSLCNDTYCYGGSCSITYKGEPLCHDCPITIQGEYQQIVLCYTELSISIWSRSEWFLIDSWHDSSF